MNGLDILRLVVSPGPSHAFRFDVIGHDFAAIGEGLMTDCAFSLLVSDFPVQQLPHLGWRPEFAISPWVVRIFDALNTKLKPAFFLRPLATAAEE